MKNEIQISDRIFATVIGFGRVLLKGQYSGMSSLDDVVREIRKSLGDTMVSLIKIVIRNYSRGWSTSMSLLQRRRPAGQPEAVQLTLF